MTRRAMLLEHLPVRQCSGRADGAVRGALDKPRPFKRGHFEVLVAKDDGLRLKEAPLKTAKAAPDAMRGDRRGQRGGRAIGLPMGRARALPPPTTLRLGRTAHIAHLGTIQPQAGASVPWIERLRALFAQRVAR